MKGICFKVRLLILSLFFITLFSACNEEPEIPQPTEAIDYSSNIRSLSEAMDIAQAFIGQNGERTRTSKSLKSIQDATVITSKSSLSRSQCDTLIYKIPLSGVISRPAASTSCRSFFIISAGIHFLSTLTVRTRLRLRTISIGANLLLSSAILSRSLKS